MPLEFETISSTRLKNLSPDTTVFFFPVGPLEDHGPHLPMGLDLQEARALCRLTAQRLESELPEWTGILMPAAPLGVETHTRRFALPIRSFVLRDWLIDACRGLEKMGFRHFVCYSGHLGPKQLTAIEDAAKILSRRRLRKFLFRKDFRISPHVTLVSASSALVSPQEARRSPFWPDALEHGGNQDTSLGLALVPEQVDPTHVSLPEIKRPSSIAMRFFNRLLRRTQSYWGTPSQASAQAGHWVLTGTVNDIFPKLRAVWEGSHPNFLFRSWYSVLPPNKSFAKAWILACFLIAIVWLYLNFTGAWLPY